MSEVKGIDNILAIQSASNELCLFIAQQVKLHHGFGIQDGIALVDKVMSDAAFRAKLEAAVKGFSEAGSEFKDLSLEESIHLAVTELEFLPQMISALKST